MERPIIFTHNIDKILDGSKTQTRRLNGLKEINKSPNGWDDLKGDISLYVYFYNPLNSKTIRVKPPYGQVGDRLWVRETFYYDESAELREDGIFYKADEWMKLAVEDAGERWQSPLFMPRWASRITLEITNIRVERLQEIRGRDCIAEGIQPKTWSIGKEREVPKTDFQLREQYPHGFKHLWNSLNPKYSWESNPWVWVIEFKKE